MDSDAPRRIAFVKMNRNGFGDLLLAWQAKPPAPQLSKTLIRDVGQAVSPVFRQ